VRRSRVPLSCWMNSWRFSRESLGLRSCRERLRPRAVRPMEARRRNPLPCSFSRDAIATPVASASAASRPERAPRLVPSRRSQPTRERKRLSVSEAALESRLLRSEGCERCRHRPITTAGSLGRPRGWSRSAMNRRWRS
jgi:hypothetical protein